MLRANQRQGQALQILLRSGGAAATSAQRPAEADQRRWAVWGLGCASGGQQAHICGRCCWEGRLKESSLSSHSGRHARLPAHRVPAALPARADGGEVITRCKTAPASLPGEAGEAKAAAGSKGGELEEPLEVCDKV